MYIVFFFCFCFFFFFKQKTAYEIRLSLVGSEMCIRDRRASPRRPRTPRWWARSAESAPPRPCSRRLGSCLLYTSDAADDLLCVDLGGRRIIKKKKKVPSLYQLALSTS